MFFCSRCVNKISFIFIRYNLFFSDESYIIVHHIIQKDCNMYKLIGCLLTLLFISCSIVSEQSEGTSISGVTITSSNITAALKAAQGPSTIRANVSVYLYLKGLESKVLDSTVSNAQGEYSFSSLPYGEYVVMADSSRVHGGVSRDVIVDAHTPRRKSVEVAMEPYVTKTINAENRAVVSVQYFHFSINSVNDTYTVGVLNSCDQNITVVENREGQVVTQLYAVVNITSELVVTLTISLDIAIGVSSTTVESSSLQTSSSSVVPPQIIDSTLVSHWKFEYTILNEVTLPVGEAHGSITYVEGVDGMAIALNGVNAGVSHPTSVPTFELPNFTLMGWVKVNAFGGYKTIWENATTIQGTGSGAGLVFHPDGEVFVTYWNGASWTFAGSQFPLLTDEWYHISGTFDGTTLNLYLNGALINSLTTTAPVVYSGFAGRFGEDHYGNANGSRALDGAIDEFKIYNIALTAEAIKNDFDNITLPISSSSVPAISSSGPILSSSGPVLSSSSVQELEPIAFWKFEDTFQDEKGMAHGVDVESNITFTSGVSGNAASFGVDNQQLQFAADSSYFHLNTYSIMGWIKIDGLGGYQDIFGNHRSVSGVYEGIALAVENSGTIYNSIGTGSSWEYVRSSGSAPIGVWTHVAAINDGENITLYFDGVQVGSSTRTGAPVRHTTVTRMGESPSGIASVKRDFNGSIDEFKVYDYAVSELVVEEDFARHAPPAYSSAPISSSSSFVSSSLLSSSSVSSSSEISKQPIAHWKFENNLTNEVVSIENGIDNGNVSYVTGVDGIALSLDSIDDGVNFPNSVSTFEIQEFTFMGWVQFKSFGAYKTIWETASSLQGSGSGSGLVLHPDGRLYVTCWNGTGWVFAGTPEGLATDQWYHISGTRGANELNLYVNGILVATTAMPNSVLYSSMIPRFGEDHTNNSNGNRSLDGYIDEFKIYDSALGLSDIQADFNNITIN